jgi:FkbM family methyltransferase
MRVFLDVGAHVGETVDALLDPKYRFERIVCFEPVASCREALRQFADPRIEIMPFGFSNRTCELQMFGAGTLAGSVFPDMVGVNEQPPEVCRFVRASEWFRENIHVGDTVFLKLNCEGSECDIIEDLLASGDFERIFASMIDFDVRKIPSQRYREAEVRQMLVESGLKNYRYCDDVMIGSTHIARIQNWLHEVGADRCPTTAKIRQGLYLLRAPAKVRRAVLGGRFGRIARAFRQNIKNKSK